MGLHKSDKSQLLDAVKKRSARHEAPIQSGVLYLKDLGQVVTKEKFSNLLLEKDSLDRRGLIYISNKNIKGETMVSSHPLKQFSYIFIANAVFSDLSSYLPFFLDSEVGRMILCKNTNSTPDNNRLRLLDIKKSFIFYAADYLQDCIYLEKTIEIFSKYLFNGTMGSNLLPLYDFLIRVRNAMTMEIAIPRQFDESRIRILDSWKIELSKLQNSSRDYSLQVCSEKSMLQLITDLFGSILSKDNLLFLNMNRVRLYKKELMESINDEIKCL